MSELIKNMRSELKANVDEKTKQSFKRFFKEEVKFHGVKSSESKRIDQKYWEQIKHLPKNEVFQLCEELLISDISEEAWIAAAWADRVNKQFVRDDFPVFERWVKRYVNNWAKCDTLCNHAVGTFIEMYPEYIEKLKQWAKSDNRWVKRAAAVSLILPARKGNFLEDVFEIADMLMHDKDDMVQKGYGWMLKEASRQHQQEIFNYILNNKKTMPRTSLRYAIEKMPPELKKQAMEK
jgi:3-methyladenine DNA glycosylase AlkD